MVMSVTSRGEGQPDGQQGNSVVRNAGGTAFTFALAQPVGAPVDLRPPRGTDGCKILKSLIENLVKQARRHAAATLPGFDARRAGADGRAHARRHPRRLRDQRRDAAREERTAQAARAGAGHRRCAARERAGCERRDRGPRLHQFPPGARRRIAQELLRVLELGERYGRSTLGAGRRVLVEFVSANPTGPLHVGHGRHAAYGATLANLLDAVGYRRRARVLHQRRRPPDGDPRDEHLAALSRALRRDVRVPGKRLPGRLPAADGGRLHSLAGRALVHRAADVFAGLPPDAPAGDKDVYIDAVIERARAAARPRALRRRFSRIGLDDILADIRNDLEEFGVVFDCWFSERSLDRERCDRARARTAAEPRRRLREGRRAMVSRDGFRRREGPRRRARERRQDLFRLGHRLPPVASASAASKCCSTCSAPITTATSRACARVSSRWASRATASRCGSAVRHALPWRRESADVDALGRVRDAARAATGSR